MTAATIPRSERRRLAAVEDGATPADALKQVITHSLLDTLNKFEQLPFSTSPEERATRDEWIIKNDIALWHLSPEPEEDD
jgi:hypothetical protein